MTNLAIKLAIASGFATALTFQGDQVQPTPTAALAASRAATTVVASETQAVLTRPRAPRARIVHAMPGAPVETSTRHVEAPPKDDLRSARRRLPGPADEFRRPAEDAATAFATEVIRLSAEADTVDRLWQVYKVECGVRVARQYDFGREWFSIWDQAAEPTIHASSCADVLWRVLQAGEGVRRDLYRARARAHQAILDQGTEIGMLRWHALQWP